MNTQVHNWSPQQTAFLDWAVNGKGSTVLEAVAGAGKTTVLLEAAEKMPGQVAIMAYNKKIAEEIKGKLQKRGVDWKKAQAGTVHSFGFKAYGKQRPNVRVDGNKIRKLVDLRLPEGDDLCVWQDAVIKLVSLAKQLAIGIMCSATDLHVWMEMAEHYDVFDEEDAPAPKDELIMIAQEILHKSCWMMDEIDFDDMIYMPLFHKVRFWQFDVVMVDEAQDTNAARRALVRAMLKRGGRVIAVGDRHQAIYGFTGADSDALDLIGRDFNCQKLPLTITYRCPKSVVEFSHQWVGHIEAADSAPDGKVSKSTMDAFIKRNDLNGEAAVLSRVTKPLVSLAFSLFRQRTPCRIEGKDVGNSLKKLLTRWKVTGLDALETRLDLYLQRETTKLLAKKGEAKLAQVEDAVETAKVIIDQCRQEKKYNVADAVEYVDQIFADDVSGVLTLSTIHKAKGREWERVFWLDRSGTCPNRWARQAWQVQQEHNLCYVAATRAKAELIELSPALPKAAAKKEAA